MRIARVLARLDDRELHVPVGIEAVHPELHAVVLLGGRGRPDIVRQPAVDAGGLQLQAVAIVDENVGRFHTCVFEPVDDGEQHALEPSRSVLPPTGFTLMPTTSPGWKNTRQASGQPGAPVRLPHALEHHLPDGFRLVEPPRRSMPGCCTATTRPGNETRNPELAVGRRARRAGGRHSGGRQSHKLPAPTTQHSHHFPAFLDARYQRSHAIYCT